MRCLFCGKRLALLRKLTDGEFCSTAHRKRYLEEEQKLALARLIEEQHRADHRRTGPEPVHPPAAERRVHEIAGFRTQQPAAKFKAFSPLTPQQKLEESIHPQMAERHGQTPAFARTLPVVGGSLVECMDDPSIRRSVTNAGDEAQQPVVPTGLRLDLGNTTGLAVSQPATAELVSTPDAVAQDTPWKAVRSGKTSIFLKQMNPVAPVVADPGPCQPASVPPLTVEPGAPMATMACRLAPAESLEVRPAVAVLEPESSRLRTTGIDIERNLNAERVGATEQFALETPWRPVAAAPSARVAAVAPPVERALAGTVRRPEMMITGGTCLLSAASEAEQSIPTLDGAWSRCAGTADAGIPAESVVTGLIPAGRTTLRQPMAPGAGFTLAELSVVIRPPKLEANTDCVEYQAQAAWMPMHCAVAPAFRPVDEVAEAVASAAAPPRMEARVGDGAHIEPAPLTVVPFRDARLRPAIRPCLPRIRTHYRPSPVPGGRMAVVEAGLCQPSIEPWRDVRRALPALPRSQACEALFGIAFRPGLCRPTGWHPEAPVAATFRPRPLLPTLRIETILAKRKAAPPPQETELSAPAAHHSKFWKAAPHFWKMAPADLKWISVALPAILLVTLISAVGWLPSKRAVPRTTAESSASGSFENVVHERWAAVRQNISERAAINLQDDFRGGLAEWEGEGNWAKDWKYDPAGFILTGALALYRPSRELTDYHFEFLGQIDRKSLNWVFRAADYKNYYAMKIVLLKNGPLPTAAVVRYAVIDGKPDQIVQSPLPITVRNDMFYRVRVDVRDNDFTTTVQGQIVDFWTDRRLGRGGVGFFSEKGERARLRWMEVSHQYDALGRLCALLAPYGIQSGNGSLSRQ